MLQAMWYIYNHVYLNRGKCEEGTDTGFLEKQKNNKMEKKKLVL